MKKILLLLFCFPFLIFGQQSFNFLHDGLNRDYIYYAPTNLPVDAPLVFVAHGFTGSAQGMMSYSGMNAIADQNGFAVCYPQGTADSWGNNFWNVGYDFHFGVAVDDIGFLESLASFLQSNYQLSSNNTFITGFSNGGEISYSLAFDGSNVFKAFAPVAGTVFPNGTINNLFNPNMPVPMFVTHGYNDNTSFYDGDPYDQFWGPYLSVDTLVDFWINEDSLTNFNIDTFPDLNNDGNITIRKKHFSSSTNNQVWLYSHNNGHNWGDSSDIVIEQEIWDFFSLFVSGCTDPRAYNYDTIAITDDGSCLYCDLTNTFVDSYNNTQGNCDGYIIANSLSSFNPITYLWSNGGTGTNITGLCAGVYSVVITDSLGCSIEDTVYMNAVPGCMDSLASNYDPLANYDDGSCQYQSNCSSPKPTGLYIYDVIDTRAKIGWNNMNDSACMVLKYFVRYREVGTNSWNTKSAGVGNGLCLFGLNTVTKQLLNLSPSTTYEFKMKAFYCGGTSSNYSPVVQFTTSDVCSDMNNLSVQTFNNNQAKAKFTWDTTGVYTFARILLRVDTAGANWQTAGSFGVYFPTFFVNKFGLTPGQTYRAQGRTFCDSNITAYRSPTWTSPIFWTQPGSIKLDGGVSINNLNVYPNPSRDLFNISFSSDKIQDLSIRILSVVRAEVYREDKQQFVGEYTKQISLDNYGKGIYFLEIETNDGVFNKKLILQ